MPGVMFSKSAARRIADGIRKIERIPGGEQNLQRQRHGGLGRSTLWEVTAVQTGPGTVTIKRVSNIDFDLNDLSEKEDIFYDPGNEPSSGDRGLLIRLGEGSLFFFRRVPAINRTYIDKISGVIPALPDTSFPDTGTAIVIDASNVTTQIGIFKFTSPLPSIATVPEMEDIFLSLKKTGLFGRPTSATISPSKIQRLNAVPTLILQDFDITNLTYNIYLTLDTVSSTAFNIWELENLSGANSAVLRHRVFDVCGATTSGDAVAFTQSFFQQSPKQVYGFAISLAWVQGGAYENGNFNWNISRFATEHGKYLSYIEWGM